LLLNGRKLSLKYYGLWIHHWIVPERLLFLKQPFIEIKQRKYIKEKTINK
jgi:hypothetical protein